MHVETENTQSSRRISWMRSETKWNTFKTYLEILKSFLTSLLSLDWASIYFYKHWDRVFESHMRNGCLYVFILWSCYSVYRQLPWDGLIPRQKSPTDCVKDQETSKAVKVQQRAVQPYIDTNAVFSFVFYTSKHARNYCPQSNLFLGCDTNHGFFSLR
jgi:hypothetical protein